MTEPQPQPQPQPNSSISNFDIKETEVTSDKRLPADEEQRQRICNDRVSNLFVEAGAGTGKTHALVERVAALVLKDDVPMESIAMITFTEKAAAELRDRIRQRFEDSDDPNAAAAIEQLDGAAVGTLHSFAKRILTEYPVESGLPPGIEVLDEIGSQVDFEQQWQQFLDDLLEDQDAATSLLYLETVGVRLDQLRSLALQMSDNWDLVEQRLDLYPPQPTPIDITALLKQFDEVLAMRGLCTNPTDKLLPKFDKIEKNKSELLTEADHIKTMASLKDMGFKNGVKEHAIRHGRKGQKSNWTIEIAEIRTAIEELGQQCDELVSASANEALAYIGARIGRFVLSSVDKRQEAGALQFHDLLVRARKLLRDDEIGREVRSSLRRQFTHILVDEFQDTDPIQIEIVVLISTTEKSVGNSEWSALPVEAGRLFFVGDPKQSIYRFRRADIGVYLAAREHFNEHAALTVNFRTVAPIISWINDVFSRLIEPSGSSQPEYVALSPHRQGSDPNGPAVAILGAEPIEEKLRADELSAAESADVAATLREVLSGAKPWQVEDRDEGWRAARPSDICILLPTRNSLTALERSLKENGIPYRVETSNLVYATREVRELMLTLRAISDPSDELATITALRSFVYGCGDDDLANWRIEHDGRFGFLAEVADERKDHPVGQALSHLKELHAQRQWLTPDALLERLIRDRAVFESAVATPTPRDVWRRLRFVVDQARAWSDAGGTDLRAYLEWARRQGRDNARVSQTVLPETDDDSVRIMTIHAAKGLEFPITVMAGMTTQIQASTRGPAVLFPPGQPALLKVSSRLSSARYEEWKTDNDEMDQHERLRLLYVAATRTRDHLIVCLHRSQKGRATNAKILAEQALAAQSSVEFVPRTVNALQPKPASRAPLLERQEWSSQHQTALTKARRRTVIAATNLAKEVAAAKAVAAAKVAGAAEPSAAADEGTATDAYLAAQGAAADDPGLNKADRNLDAAPWFKGRYGTAIGRAVHGVLQVVDLATGDGLPEAARVQAAAEGVDKQRSVVERMARTALCSQVAQQAAAAEHWREVWVGATVGECVVEGYIDLLYRQRSGLVVVDWKTDQADDEADINVKLQRYRLQGASYVAALEHATGLRVERMVFVFLGEDQPVERELLDLRGAIDEVKQHTRELTEAADRG